MADLEIEDYFSRASKLDEPAGEGGAELIFLDGVKRFKRRVLGIRRKQRLLSVEELAEIFSELGMVRSIEEGRKLVPEVIQSAGCDLCYSLHHDKYLAFSNDINGRGEAVVKISVKHDWDL